MNSAPDTTFKIAVLDNDPAALAAAGKLPGIEWLACRRSGETQLEFVHADGGTSKLDFEQARFDLPDVIALVVVGDADRCRDLSARWKRSFPAVDLEFVALPALDAQSLANAAVGCLARTLARQREFSGRAALDLAVYRREFERLQHSFSALEDYVSRNSLHRPLVLFDYPATAGKPAAAAARAPDPLGRRPGSLRVLQMLPVDSLGVAGIALFLRGKAQTGDTLQIRLLAMENDRTFGAWSIAAAELPSGWLHLSLSRAIDVPALSLLVAVELPAGLDANFLALGQPHPYAEFRARIDGAETLAAPLALRVFGGLPGVRVPGVTGAFVASDATRPPVIAVPPELYADARQVYPLDEPGAPKFVLYDDPTASLTVHPHERGTMTVARLDLTAPANVWCISARVALAHERANPTHFGLMAVPAVKKGADDILMENLQEKSTSFSGWVELSALEKRKISVFLPKGPASAVTVYLMTRQAPDASPDFAWARFEGFEFNASPQ